MVTHVLLVEIQKVFVNRATEEENLQQSEE